MWVGQAREVYLSHIPHPFTPLSPPSPSPLREAGGPQQVSRRWAWHHVREEEAENDSLQALKVHRPTEDDGEDLRGELSISSGRFCEYRGPSVHQVFFNLPGSEAIF